MKKTKKFNIAKPIDPQGEALLLIKALTNTAEKKLIKKIPTYRKEVINTRVELVNSELTNVSPLFWAFYKELPNSILRALIEAGGDLDCKAKHQKDPDLLLIKLIVELDNVRLLEIFLQYVDDQNYPSLSADVFWVDKGTKINILHQAAAFGSNKCLKHLLLRPDLKEQVNCDEPESGTPLFQAVKFSNQEGFKLLLENGANPDILCVGGQTVRDYVKKYFPDWKKDLLAEQGVTFDSAEKVATSFFQIVSKKNDIVDLDLVKKLLNVKGVFPIICQQRSNVLYGVVQHLDFHFFKFILNHLLFIESEQVTKQGMLKLAAIYNFYDKVERLLPLVNPDYSFFFKCIIKNALLFYEDGELLKVALNFKILEKKDFAKTLKFTMKFKWINKFGILLAYHQLTDLDDDTMSELILSLFTAKKIASEDKVKFLNRLINWGIDVCKELKDGATIPLYAAAASEVDCFKALIKEGASLPLTIFGNSTFVFLAEISGFSTRMLDYLTDDYFKQSPPKEILASAMAGNNLQLVKHLIRKYNLDDQESFYAAQHRKFLSLMKQFRLPEVVKPEASKKPSKNSKTTISGAKSLTSPAASYNPFLMQPDKPLNARSYLIQQGFTPDEIRKMQEPTDKEQTTTKNAPKIAARIPSVFQKEKYRWFNCLNQENFKSIDSQFPCYFFLDAKQIINQGCPENVKTRFEKRRLKFDAQHLKNIADLNLTLKVNLPYEQEKTVKLTHELKIEGKERILAFPWMSDDQKAVLYIGCKYCPAGIHELRDIKSLRESNAVFTINLPLPFESIDDALSQLANSPIRKL